MICTRPGNFSGHDGQDVRMIVRFLRHSEEPCCKGCRDAMTAHGADWRFGRSQDRPFTPRWMERLTARDETGRAA